MLGVKRQTLVRENYPCDLYSGEDLSSNIGVLLKRLSPLRCKVVVLHDDRCDSFLLNRISQIIIDSDNTLIDIQASDLSSDILSISAFENLVSLLEQNHITADDVVISVGSSSVLSLANYIAKTYKKGIGFIAYPLDMYAAYSAAVDPEYLCLSNSPCLSCEPCSDQVLLDWTYLDQPDNRPFILSLLFKGSLAAGDDLYRWLYEFSDKLSSQEGEDSQTKLLWRNALLMGLHELCGSKNLRWAYQIQNAFADVLEEASDQTIIYETISFATKLAVAHNKSSIDFVREVDDVMGKLGFISYITSDITAEELHQAMRKSFFASRNRMLFDDVVNVGVVQPVLVDDEILKSHCAAWVRTHR